jgi:hypothetical protein
MLESKNLKTWINRIIGVLAIGGGWYSITMILRMFRDPVFSLGDKFFFIVFLGLYIWGIICGIYVIAGQKKGLNSIKYVYAFQIPVFMSKFIGYTFCSGMFFNIKYSFKYEKFSADYLFGSLFSYNLLSARPDYYIGVNILSALVLLYLLLEARAK